MGIKILHFADAHINMMNYGRYDPASGLPLRVMDYLKSLDTIVDRAIDQQVDLVLFAGDAYKDRNPAITYQREWNRRIMRLSKAKIPTLLLVGNHDLSPALGRAHALESFDTLEVPNVQVIDRPTVLKPDDLGGIPLQILALPWISRSGLMAFLDLRSKDISQVYDEIGDRIIELVHGWLEQVDPGLPVVFTAHCSVQGASYGVEHKVMLGRDVVLPGSLVKDPRFDYVALGHIHKSQDLNAGNQPPVIYPGSIERVDFGEAQDDKFFVIAVVEKGNTQVEWCKLENIRPFVDRFVRLESQEAVTEHILQVFPPAEQLKGAIVRLVLEYPRDWEASIDEASLRDYMAEAFSFSLEKHAQVEGRIRLPGDPAIGSLSVLELLDVYWRASHVNEVDIQVLNQLATDLIRDSHVTQSEGE